MTFRCSENKFMRRQKSCPPFCSSFAAATLRYAADEMISKRHRRAVIVIVVGNDSPSNSNNSQQLTIFVRTRAQNFHLRGARNERKRATTNQFISSTGGWRLSSFFWDTSLLVHGGSPPFASSCCSGCGLPLSVNKRRDEARARSAQKSPTFVAHLLHHSTPLL